MLRPFGAEKGCMSPSLCLLVFDSVVALEKREIDRVPKFFSLMVWYIRVSNCRFRVDCLLVAPTGIGAFLGWINFLSVVYAHKV